MEEVSKNVWHAKHLNIYQEKHQKLKKYPSPIINAIGGIKMLQLKYLMIHLSICSC